MAKLCGGDASPSFRIGASFREPSIEIVIIRLVIGWSCIKGSKKRIGPFRQLLDQSVQGFAAPSEAAVLAAGS